MNSTLSVTVIFDIIYLVSNYFFGLILCLYVLIFHTSEGGLDNIVWPSTEIYNGSTNTMSPGVNLPSSNMFFCVVGLRSGEVFLTGGRSSTITTLQLAHTFNFGTNLWTAQASMTDARYRHGCARIPKGINTG